MSDIFIKVDNEWRMIGEAVGGVQITCRFSKNSQKRQDKRRRLCHQYSMKRTGDRTRWDEGAETDAKYRKLAARYQIPDLYVVDSGEVVCYSPMFIPARLIT